MKVIKDGKIGNPDNWQTKIVCEKKDRLDSEVCGAELEVTEKDLVMMYWHGTHFKHCYTAAKCPQCGKYNRVEEVPQPIWERFNTTRRRELAIFDGFTEEI